MSEANEPRYLRILKNLDALGCTLIANRAKAGTLTRSKSISLSLVAEVDRAYV